jgi:hypothetical protein
VGEVCMGGGLYLLSNRAKIRIQYYKYYADIIRDIQTTAGLKGRFCKVKIKINTKMKTGKISCDGK